MNCPRPATRSLPAAPAPRPASPPSFMTAAPRALRRAAAAVLAAAFAVAGCSDQAAKQPAPRAPVEAGVVTIQPERQSITTELPGRTSAFLVAEIRPQVGGIVQKRLFTEGADSVGIGNLTVEDAGDAVALYGSLTIEATKGGLEKAERLLAIATATVAKLRAMDLPDALPEANVSMRANPFEE